MKDREDAYGHEVLDYLQGENVTEIIEREDGYIAASGGPGAYFSDYKDWPGHQKRAMRFVRGRVLDIGCGAGRHSLYLQGEKGHDVVGIDVSPLAVEVCRRRGVVDVRAMSITEVSSKLSEFDTILMLGANFGLFGDFHRAKRLLKRFHHITTDKARIVAETRDPVDTLLPDHLEYHQINRDRGRMPGQVRIRVRYGKYRSSWFDYLFVSKDEMQTIFDGTGWRIRRLIDTDDSVYIAIIEKTKL